MKKHKKYYHFTTRKNAYGICLVEHLTGGLGNYVCDSLDDLNKFLAYSPISNKDLAIIEFTTDAEFKESFDHDKNIIKAKAFVSFDPVKIDITNIRTL